MKVPLTLPFMKEEEKKLVESVIESGWLTQGDHVTGFENKIAEYAGSRHAVACSNCTTALHVSLILNHIGPDDEVIIPSYTWIATANVVRMVGAKPVFIDIDIDSFNIKVANIESSITPQTKAIIPVHQFGLPADMDDIMALAIKYNLKVIEDAACAIGSRYRNRNIGGLGNIACFSFHPRKIITTGEGGMLLTDNEEIASKARILINHGASITDQMKHHSNTVENFLAEEFREVGYNYRMTNLQGALGLAQLEKLDKLLTRRKLKAKRYEEALSDINHIITPKIPDDRRANWQSYAIRISKDSPVSRNKLTQSLLDTGIACRPAYMACHSQPVYKDLYPDLKLPETDEALRTVIILPLYPQMTEQEQDYVIEMIRKYLGT